MTQAMDVEAAACNELKVQYIIQEAYAVICKCIRFIERTLVTTFIRELTYIRDEEIKPLTQYP